MPRDPRAYLQRAEEHRRHGRLKEAIALSIEALGKHPGLDAVRVTLGRAYLENAQPEEARTTLLEVFGRLPEHHLAGKLLIESQRLLGDLGGAEATCRTLLGHYPRDREIEPLLAEIVRARSSSVIAEAPVGLPATPPTRPAAVPAPAAGRAAVVSSVGPPRVAASPAVAVEPSDPEPEYFPEDIASAPGSPVPQPVAARPAAATPAIAPAPVNAVPATTPPPRSVMPPPAAAVMTPPAPAVVVAPMASASSPAPAASATTAARPAPSPASAAKDALETNTLAELYVKQGLPDRAIDVYRSMLRVEPGNAAAKRRLAELEGAAALAAPRTEKAERGDRGRATAPKGPAPAADPGAPIAVAVEAAAPAAAETAGHAGSARDRAAIERLEGWLAAVKRGQDRQGGGAAA